MEEQHHHHPQTNSNKKQQQRNKLGANDVNRIVWDFLTIQNLSVVSQALPGKKVSLRANNKQPLGGMGETKSKFNALSR